MGKQSRGKRKKRRGRKREQVRVSEGLKSFIQEEQRRIRRQKGVDPSEEDVLIDKMEVEEEQLFEDDDEPDFMDLF